MEQQSRFNVAEARRLVDDLFMADPWVYWPDFLLSIGIGWAGFYLAVILPFPSWAQAACALAGALGLYRGVIFIHELTHLKKDSFGLFRLVWNLACGFPLMVPSFTYMGVHIEHHKQKVYGTKYDGEYYPYVLRPPFEILKSVLQTLLGPALFLLRFTVVFPLSYAIPGFRKRVWENASSLSASPDFKRPAPGGKEARSVLVQESLTFAFGWAGIALMAAHVLPWRVLGVWYFTAFVILCANAVRTLAAHRYRNAPDNVLTFGDQFLDSVDVEGGLWTMLWAPVGLRFHATHHLFPGMPYHNLGKAHQRLKERMTDPEPYMSVCEKSLWDALRALWQDAQRHREGATRAATTE